MSPVNRDEKTVAITIALAVCVLVYIVGALVLVALDAMLHFSQGVGEVLSVLLLFASMLGAVVILLRDRRRTPGR